MLFPIKTCPGGHVKLSQLYPVSKAKLIRTRNKRAK